LTGLAVFSAEKENEQKTANEKNNKNNFMSD
jgi:hypothetical protein